MTENWVVAEIGTNDHGEQIELRAWGVDTVTRLAALREVAAANPGHGPLKIVDGPGMVSIRLGIRH